ncbi:hypothetical protein HZR84_09995 [Hyphobacterium sp. CCMP332]|nr:hypothetical protein HZR84_09995 [Hyphobacterium sp. CCMP332]
MFDSFGNKVKIKDSPETREKELAGKVGDVYGQTTPSMMDFEIIGTPKDDFAVNVYFDDLQTSYWFDADLLETIDDGQGSVITLDGVDKKWTKGENGQWIEEDTTPTTQSPDKKWWEFWK